MIELKTNTETLKSLLFEPAIIAAKNPAIPSLSFLLLVPDENGITAIGSSVDIEVSVRVSDIASSGDPVLLPTSKITSILKTLENDRQVRIVTKDDDRVLMRAGNGQYTLSTLDVGSFPRIAETASIQEATPMTIEAKELENGLKMVGYAAARNDVRYYLNGVLMERIGGRLFFVATDGHRLAVYETPSEGEDFAVILTNDAVDVLRKLLRGRECETSVRIGKGYASFEFEEVCITMKLVDGKYPEWKKVLPKKNGTYSIVDRENLVMATTRIGILTNEKHHGLRIDVWRDEMEISTMSDGLNKGEEKISCESTFETISFGINQKYLQESLSLMSGEALEIHLPDLSMSPVLITDPELPMLSTVIMPLKL